MTKRTCLVLRSALLLAAACGDDSSGSAGIDSGLAADKPLATLTPQEAHQLCDATLDAISDLYPREIQAEGACSVAGSALAIVVGPDGRAKIDQSACERHRDACIAQVEATPSVETRSCDVGSADRKATCKATVGDYERCAAASIRAAALYSEENWTCAALAAQPVTLFPTTAPMEMPVVDVPECETFMATCGPFEMPML